MNENQKTAAICVGIALSLMLSFPPFSIYGQGGMVHNVGYGFIFDPPQRGAVINIQTLLIQWFFVITIGAISYTYFKE